MSRGDLIVTLIRSGSTGDQTEFKRAAEALIAEERAKKHHILADRLAQALQTTRRTPAPAVSHTGLSQSEFFFESDPKRTLSDLMLPETVSQACKELVEEQHRAELLQSHALEPRHRVLLAGPPGNGKTSLADALANELMVPLISVRYEGLIGSYLGETANRLQKVFDYVTVRRCILFFDEFDTVGKERGDQHETGEIKRVVSTLLLQTDRLPSYVVVVAASNHPELLDRAVWRRFQLRLALPAPSNKQISQYIEQFVQRTGLRLGHTPDSLAKHLSGASYAEAEGFCSDILRRAILAQRMDDATSIVKTCLQQWKARLKPDL